MGKYQGKSGKMTEIVNCLLCGTSGRKEIYSFQDGTSIVQCLECGFVYTSPRLDAESRRNIYSTDYFSASSGHGIGMDYIENAAVFKNDAEERFGIIRKYLPAGKLANVLELGSAAGFFIKEVSSHGHEAVGIEISAGMVRYAKDILHVNCFQGQLADVPLEDDHYDIVAMWHVLEHLENPVETLKTLHRKMTENSYIFIAVPNFASGNSIRFRENWGHLQSKVHLSHFTPESMRCCLEKSGFEMISCVKSGGTGILGTKSNLNENMKKIIISNIGRFGIVRRPLKYILSNFLRRDDFITVIGKKI